ncbi:hypothetical protein JAAARDRAFT_28772 [Jaapia argillacea MUCL 33604]|uniref:Uncharacterized protein n=1 Tax=Jaapia argillacea MUCL 33604 TaxID=933084 RepID=A0A067QFY9_9AGAM|nr:hypothetical protein JAAARDRAFT_28772 [Jaapia argillacea MUCL 33604]
MAGGGFLHRLRSFVSSYLPFMGESPPDSLPHAVFQDERSRLGVVQWKDSLEWAAKGDSQADQIHNCFLVSAEYRKSNSGKQHEFLHLHIQHRPSQSSIYAIVERLRPITTDSTESLTSEYSSSSISENSSTRDLALVSTSASDRVAHDQVYFTRSPAIPWKDHRLLLSMNFPDVARQPPVLDLAFILAFVHEHSDLYKIFSKQCFWYAAVVWGTLKEEFGGQETVVANECGVHWGIRWVNEDQKMAAVTSTRAGYNTALQTFRQEIAAKQQERVAYQNKISEQAQTIANLERELALIKQSHR